MNARAEACGLRFGFLALALLVSCPAAYGKHSDEKNTSRAISGVTSQFEVLNTVIRSGEPIKIRVTLRNESASPVEFRYVPGSFIEHIRIYDRHHHQVPVRPNAPFLESGADKVILQPDELFEKVVTADLWQMYDLGAGTYQLRFYYDLRLIADETLAARSMKRYHSKDWVAWNTKTYRLSIVDQQVNDSVKPRILGGEGDVSRSDSTFFSSGHSELRRTKRQTVALVTSVTKPRLGSNIDDFRSTWGTPSNEEVLIRTARFLWRWSDESNEPQLKGIFEAEVSFLDGLACEVVLRSKEQLKKTNVINLAKALVVSFEASDLATLKPGRDGSRTYAIRDGGYIVTWARETPAVMVIRNRLFLQNAKLFDQEAARVRPPTSNH